jgi:hypothetical protein
MSDEDYPSLFIAHSRILQVVLSFICSPELLQSTPIFYQSAVDVVGENYLLFSDILKFSLTEPNDYLFQMICEIFSLLLSNSKYLNE